MKRLGGRPRKKANERGILKSIRIAPENHSYIMGIIKKNSWNEMGHYSRLVNEIIQDHRKIKKFKDIQAGKLREQLELLE